MRINRKIPNKSSVLVLNADYLPINVTSFKKAFNLVFKNKANVIESEGEFYSSNNKYPKPSVIKLVKYVNLPHRKVVLSKENIFKRDGYRCAYCSSNRNLTVDHILPKSQNGKNTWENLITCCFKCNSFKGDKTPEQANMKLLFEPTKPNPFYFISMVYNREEKWQPYLMFD